MRLYASVLSIALLLSACASRQAANSVGPGQTVSVARPEIGKEHPRYELHSEHFWQLNLPDSFSFDASGLVFDKSGDLLTVNDKKEGIYRIELPDNGSSADLERLDDCFTPAQLAPFAGEKIGRYDCEGIARDEAGRLYVCEEANRWILRFDPKAQTLERLQIDWSPVKQYFHPADLNASFEGVAVAGNRLYVANERRIGRIIVVDLTTLKVVDDFMVQPAGIRSSDIHYSDLCWFEGALFVLLRESRCVLKVNPANHVVLAEYDFSELETAPETRYYKLFPTVGNMEGLAVDQHSIWLVTDNNGLGRVRFPKDIRPTLFKCQRPD